MQTAEAFFDGAIDFVKDNLIFSILFFILPIPVAAGVAFWAYKISFPSLVTAGIFIGLGYMYVIIPPEEPSSKEQGRAMLFGFSCWSWIGVLIALLVTAGFQVVQLVY